MSARRRVLPLVLLGALSAAAATLPEPLGPDAGAWWQSASLDLLCDTARRELRPARSGVSADWSYEFSTTGPDPQLRLDLAAATTEPGDAITVSVSWDGRIYTEVPAPDLPGRHRVLDLSPYLRERGPLTVRLAVSAVGDPRGVAVRGLSWSLSDVTALPGALSLPPAAWFAAATRAAAEARLAPPRPPAAPARAGGPARLAVGGPWRRLNDALVCEEWDPGRRADGAIWTVLALPNGTGGSLAVDGLPRDAHDWPATPLGATIEPPATMETPMPSVAVAGVADPARSVVLRRTARLEIRRVAPAAEGLHVVVYGHGVGDQEASLRAAVRDRSGRVLASVAAGALVSPGAWLVPLRLPATTGGAGVTLSIDDGAAVSDRLELPWPLRGPAWAVP